MSIGGFSYVARLFLNISSAVLLASETLKLIISVVINSRNNGNKEKYYNSLKT